MAMDIEIGDNLGTAFLSCPGHMGLGAMTGQSNREHLHTVQNRGADSQVGGVRGVTPLRSGEAFQKMTARAFLIAQW